MGRTFRGEERRRKLDQYRKTRNLRRSKRQVDDSEPESKNRSQRAQNMDIDKDYDEDYLG